MNELFNKAYADMQAKGLVSVEPTWLQRAIQQNKVTIELARTIPLVYNLDFLDFFIMCKESSN